MNWQAQIIAHVEAKGIKVERRNHYFLMGDKKVHFVDLTFPYPPIDPGDLVIHEDQFHTRRKALYNRLFSKLSLNQTRIFARKTTVRLIQKSQASLFMDEHHLLGYHGGKTHLGLFSNDQLVAVAIFSRTRQMKYETPPYSSTELERFACENGITVVGGLSKLISYYIKNYLTDDLITTIDKEWSDARAYEGIGFERIGETEPLTFQVNKNTWERTLSQTDQENESISHSVYNAGNIKLRKWIHPTDKIIR